VDWTDTLTPGLSLRVSPGGAKAWYVLYKLGTKARRKKLGDYPALTLAKARMAARDDRLRVDRDGADPAAERREEKAAAAPAFTVADLCKLYLTHAEQTKRTWKDDRWRIEKYILPAWKGRAVASITRSDAHAVLDKIVADGKPIQANRVQALISKLWNVAIDREHASVNPCYRMAKHAAERRRETVLDDDALRGLWTALDAAPGDAADAIRLRLLTGQRGGEVHQIEWSEIDLPAKLWTLPASKAKNKRAHTVPLSAAAVAILELRLEARAEKERRVFPGLYHQREDLRDLAAIHNGRYRWHDLRRVVASRLAALGCAEEVIGRVLNHAKRGITATVYNRHAYDKEKRAALDAWARELDRIIHEQPKAGADVVNIHTRR
jgi:integrase